MYTFTSGYCGAPDENTCCAEHVMASVESNASFYLPYNQLAVESESHVSS